MDIKFQELIISLSGKSVNYADSEKYKELSLDKLKEILFTLSLDTEFELGAHLNTAIQTLLEQYPRRVYRPIMLRFIFLEKIVSPRGFITAGSMALTEGFLLDEITNDNNKIGGEVKKAINHLYTKKQPFKPQLEELRKVINRYEKNFPETPL